MDVFEAIESRRAVRAYTDRQVDRATVERLLRAAVHAPSAMNAQPWAFAIIQERGLLRLYSERAKAHLLDLDQSDPRMRHLREILASPDFDVFYGAGTLITICAADLPGAAEDCSLAGQNLMLAACDLGLGTCPIGFARPLLNLPEVKAELGIPASFSPVLPIIVGFPKGATPPVPRDPARILCWR